MDLYMGFIGKINWREEAFPVLGDWWKILGESAILHVRHCSYVVR